MDVFQFIAVIGYTITIFKLGYDYGQKEKK